MSDRVEIFVDGSNFYNGLKKQFGDGRCDFAKLIMRILMGRQLICFNSYTGIVDRGREAKKFARQQAFLTNLQLLPFPVRIYSRPLQYVRAWPSIPPREKGIDARIVQDLIIGALDQRFDVAVLLSGDQDFRDVVQLVTARFTLKMETYYPASRRHLAKVCHHCLSNAGVITRKFYDSIRDASN